MCFRLDTMILFHRQNVNKFRILKLVIIVSKVGDVLLVADFLTITPVLSTVFAAFTMYNMCNVYQPLLLQISNFIKVTK